MAGAKQEARRVLIAAGLDHDAPSSFVTLPDPKSGQPSTYLLSNNLLQEVNWQKQQFSSWFVNDAVIQDGGLYICTPVDPLFIALPLLERAKQGGQQARGSSGGEGSSGGSAGIFCDAEQVVAAAGEALPPAAAQQLTSLLAPALHCVCDCKTAGGQEYFRLNEDKVLAWLRLKVGQARQALVSSSSSSSAPPAPSGGSGSAAGTDSSSAGSGSSSAGGGMYAGMEGPALTAYAAGMVGEYISASWATRLAKALGLPEQGSAAAAGASGGSAAAGAHTPPLLEGGEGYRAEKRPRLDPKEAAKAKAAEARATAKAQKLAKEASGMRKLSAFFAPRK